ncbi:diacylglycerol kinase family protein [Hansschlegelia plantiphila]|uniref:Diacylglycerol kinase n=1 Tax=Hansschlegelia plantiphila TaxID=374655 RepID=A0A9W6MXF2_9HYPH|nr:diacylglycerol kinase family protein [Hansschlegelia plantiphila]GLK69835.1 diacylglycerol kinase [Hansschlegelia plantiphila]
MTRLGVVANGRSWRNRNGRAAPPASAGVLFEAPDSPADYPEVMRRFAAAGVTTLAIDGGDGTLRDVMSAMAPAFGDALPQIALLPNGKTNVAAADVGGAGRGPDAVGRLAAALSADAPLTTTVRRPLAISFDGRSVYGFVFGLGAFERATRLVDERVHERGFAQKLGVALGVVGSVSTALFGKERAAWSRGVPLSLALDGGGEATHDSFALLATSLRRWVLGLWPFWGTGEGAIAVTEISAPPRRLALGLATAGLGRPRPWAAAEGWRSERADRVSLSLRAPFIIDGDRFEPGPDGAVEIRSGPPLSFVRL